jgi:hypothetical protein
MELNFTLTESNIEIIRSYLPENKRTQFEEQLSLLRQCMEQKGWLPTVSRSRSKIYVGLKLKSQFKMIELTREEQDKLSSDEYRAYRDEREAVNRMKWIVKDASIPHRDEFEKFVKYLPKKFLKEELAPIEALCKFKKEVVEIHRTLDQLRPLPVKSEVKLSPRVTETLKIIGINEGIDLATVRMPPIKYFRVQLPNGKIGWKAKIIWPEDTVFGMSRFTAHTGHCEACGKLIPSGEFLPLLANTKEGTPMCMIVGRDCAKNLFGVKSEGFKIDELKFNKVG